MIREEKHFAGKRCPVFADEAPELLLVEPMDERDLAFLDRELAPWPSGPVFGKEAFGDGAPATLRLIEEKLIPETESRQSLRGSRPADGQGLLVDPIINT